MEFLLQWLLLASVQLAATMSPGPAFILAVRNALAHDRRCSIATACGLGLGVAVHAFLTLAGMATLIAHSPALSLFIRYTGAAYLIYIGLSALFHKADSPAQAQPDMIAAEKKARHFVQAFRTGFLTNLLNPKALVFFTAIFSQFVDSNTPWQVLVTYGLTSVTIEFLWFAVLGLALGSSAIRQGFARFSGLMDRVFGGMLVALGMRLAV